MPGMLCRVAQIDEQRVRQHVPPSARQDRPLPPSHRHRPNRCRVRWHARSRPAAAATGAAAGRTRTQGRRDRQAGFPHFRPNPTPGSGAAADVMPGAAGILPADALSRGTNPLRQRAQRPHAAPEGNAASLEACKVENRPFAKVAPPPTKARQRAPAVGLGGRVAMAAGPTPAFLHPARPPERAAARCRRRPGSRRSPRPVTSTVPARRRA